MRLSNTIHFAVAALLLGFSITGVASTTTPLFNHNRYSVGQGDFETDFGVDVRFRRGDVSSDSFAMMLGGNYFISDMLAPGVEFAVVHEGNTGVRLLPNIKVYLPLGDRVLPFAQAGIGFAHIGDFNGFNIALGAGVKYLLSSTVALGVQLRYDLLAGDGTVHEIQLPISFAIFFKV